MPQRNEEEASTLRILLLEYVTGGGLDPGPAADSLIAEGLLMRAALLADLAEIPGTAVAVMHDRRLRTADRPERSDVEYLPVASASAFEPVWRTALAGCDAVWPIAPETGGLLARLCRDAEAAGCTLLTASSCAVELAGNKLATIAALKRLGVPAIATRPVDPGTLPETFPVVVKPTDGAGCDGVRILRDAAEWRIWLAQSGPADAVVQPLLGGESRSLCTLFAGGRACLLSCNGQQVHVEGAHLRLAACTVNLTDIDWTEAERLAAAVAAAMPELWGYAGIDYLQTGAGPVVLEVNPRLTTSYVGLRRALDLNVAAQVLELQRTGRLPSPSPRRGRTVRIDIPRHAAA